MAKPSILIAGIGNIFLGDDAFGVEVAQRLMKQEWPEEVRVADFGIRGIDLVYGILEGYGTVILVDAAPRGGSPGDLYVIEPEPVEVEPDELGMYAPLEMHRMDPLHVMRAVSLMGGAVGRVLVVGCEPTPLVDEEDIQATLSEPVQAAIDPAIQLIRELINEAIDRERTSSGHSLASGSDDNPKLSQDLETQAKEWAS
jgi:hydrogenase maturation protease